MGISYGKSGKILIDENVRKGGVQKAAGKSASSFAQLAKDESFKIDILVKIFTALVCKNLHIMEIDHSNKDKLTFDGECCYGRE